MKEKRTYTLKLMAQDKSLFNSIILKGEKERELILNILNTIRKHAKAKELEKIYGGSAIYNLLKKLEKAGMIEKTADGYKLSKKFSNILRAWAEEWEEFVEE